MNKIIIGLLALVAVYGAIVGSVALVGGNQSVAPAPLGASGTRFPNGISADSTSPSAGQVRGTTFTFTGDGTVSGGTLNITTANSATSTVVVGCVQFYATSTATSQKFQASTTPGIMYSQYGTCPNL